MELRMQPFTLPDAPRFNFEELKAALEEKTALYASRVYTDDQIVDAKADRAALNRLKKALNDERIKREREYMQPFAEFKSQIAEIIAIIDTPIASIDAQVKEYEAKKREEKMAQIEAVWQEVLAADKVPAGVCFNHIFQERWLNASVSMKTVREALCARLEQIDRDLSVIRSLPSCAYEAERVYFSTFDLAGALYEANRRADDEKKRRQYEADRAQREAEEREIKMILDKGKKAAKELLLYQAQHAPAPHREWLGFQAHLTIDEAAELGTFFKVRGIQYREIE